VANTWGRLSMMDDDEDCSAESLVDDILERAVELAVFVANLAKKELLLLEIDFDRSSD
jgi:hypothetical protein